MADPISKAAWDAREAARRAAKRERRERHERVRRLQRSIDEVNRDLDWHLMPWWRRLLSIPPPTRWPDPTSRANGDRPHGQNRDSA